MTRRRDGDWIELWNLKDDGLVRADLQHIFNIVGHVNRPEEVKSLSYTLNGGKEVPIFFKRATTDSGRLERFGDFNVDTISIDDLADSNEIVFVGRSTLGRINRKRFNFSIRNNLSATNNFKLELTGVSSAQEVGQIVDGRWIVGGEDEGDRFLEIRASDSGLDRIMLLGPSNVGLDYRVKARLGVTSWTAPLHNVGLLFKWNDHLKGDGRSLPTQWTTGLAYYYSQCEGIRLRVGKNVHIADSGRKVGDHVLCETHLSWWKCQVNRLLAKMRLRHHFLPQIVPGRQYHFELSITSQRNSLTVWQVGRRKPKPQLISGGTDNLIASGSVGIIAHKCGVRIYEFDYASMSTNASNR